MLIYWNGRAFFSLSSFAASLASEVILGNPVEIQTAELILPNIHESIVKRLYPEDDLLKPLTIKREEIPNGDSMKICDFASVKEFVLTCMYASIMFAKLTEGVADGVSCHFASVGPIDPVFWLGANTGLESEELAKSIESGVAKLFFMIDAAATNAKDNYNLDALLSLVKPHDSEIR